ncbi:BlaI/MecI/CopY family transcriptional regulator [Candidatus Bathyarchaeota archaeon]|jgi:BlaI family transcriptional regulator, penicillinase repressor|nr:BlaI/MecI/CopY family transcriptional regulator [Candidatus Bathyarchaeota archaeon]MBT4320146.1 BlaI/MecI/CopY family transcriptional regulator [Candidatus Bathyarchaeota archaeon]MBT4424800.1 BlaI/MecI/CopY family transcriptional regulator [Candidatus Bathyarchaeota archaeon]MBT5641625.1 BlaI/MecI/CopY family transcriptional regulator [Candidatus Bathyarchaeota archaeon]MBT6603976.1 BlaI/MecI/CopY family transcriptional regulator [Candidatus Bathyarchaeota archaeon]
MTSDTDWLDFQPHKQDLGKVLGDLEADIMTTIWSIKSGDVKTIHRELNKERKAAVTTVATVLDRLHGKNLVQRELVKGAGVRYVYSPALTRNQFDSTIVRNVFKGLFESFGESAISYLVQSTGIEDRDALEELRTKLEKIKDE